MKLRRSTVWMGLAATALLVPGPALAREGSSGFLDRLAIQRSLSSAPAPAIRSSTGSGTSGPTGRLAYLLQTPEQVSIFARGVVQIVQGTPAAPSMGLQEILDSEFGPGAVDATSDVIPDGSDALWQASPGATANLRFEFSDFAPSNTFGIYDSSAPEFRLPLFYGYHGPDSQASLSIQSLAGGGYRFTVSNNGVDESAIFGSSVFGFYLRTPDDEVFLSETNRNSDGFDHLRAYAEPGAAGALADSYLLAWADLANGGDGEFNDLVVRIRGFSPVQEPAPIPLPGTAVLLVSGLAGLVGARRFGPRSRNCNMSSE